MQYIKQILTVFSVGLILFTMYTQNNKITELKTTVLKQEKLVDSLQTDLFLSKMMNGRYELALDYLKVTNVKVANQFETFMSNETE
jgi:uncharacterized membrane protein YciS (DUF1049 family)